MATINEVVSEINTNEALIQAFYSNLANFQSGQSSVPPELSSILDGIVVDAEQTTFNSTLGNNRTLPIGLIGEFLFRYFSLNREGSLVYKDKIDYYNDETQFCSDVVNKEIEQITTSISMIRGYATDQVGILS